MRRITTALVLTILFVLGCSASDNDSSGVSITAPRHTAWEYSGDYIEFVVDLGSPNETAGNILVYFETSGSALERSDVAGNPDIKNGYVEIPPGLQTAMITIDGITGDGVIRETQSISFRITGCSSPDFPIGRMSEATAVVMDGDGPIVTDVDNNQYHTVKIGGQTWMVENLKTTRLNDYNQIRFGTDWRYLINIPGFCWYGNTAVNLVTYGALYNWPAVATGKLCPKGWHVPSDKEWTTLIDYLGGKKSAGGKMKESGVARWDSPNTGADNSSGFTALPGGFHNSDFYFGLNWFAFFWTSTPQIVEDRASIVYVEYKSSVADWNISMQKTDSCSVRCIQD